MYLPQTPDVSITFAEKKCLQTFYYPDIDLSIEGVCSDHNKKMSRQHLKAITFDKQ